MISAHGDAYTREWPELDRLIPDDALRVLEVGCGTGALGRHLKEGHPRREVVGIEPDYDAAEYARKQLDKVFVGPLERTDLFYPDGYFDCILYPDVLHRLVDPWVVLRRHRRLLSPAGLLLARVPNLQYLQNLKKGLPLRTESIPGGPDEAPSTGLTDRQSLRHFTREDVRQLFFESGFEIEFVQPDQGPELEPFRRMTDCKTLVIGRSSIDLRGLPEEQISQFLLPHFMICARHRAEPAVPRTVSIIMPVCGQLEYTRQCLDSLFAQTPAFHELILIDNGSDDGTPGHFQRLLEGWEDRQEERESPPAWNRPDGPPALSLAGDSLLRVITNSKNIGFPAAVNQGLRTATGEYVLVLNNDTILTEGWLEGLLRCAEGAPQAGIVGPTSNAVLRTQNDPHALYEGADGLAEYAERVRPARWGQWLEVPNISGVCMLIRRAVIEEVGEFDERFGYGTFEDNDFCLRARQAGFRVLVAAEVFIHHFGGRTFDALGVDLEGLLRRNEQLFQDKLREPSPPDNPVREPQAEATLSGPVALAEVTPEAPETYPSLIRALMEKGREAARIGQFDEALDALGKALEYEPSRAEAHNDLAWVCFRKGLPDRAEAHWQKAIELDARNVAAVRNLADFYFSQERFAEALGRYEQLVRDEAADVEVIDALGDAYFELHHYEAAALAYETLAQAFRTTDATSPAAERAKQKLQFARQRQRECLIV